MRILIISESINVEDSSASKGRVALIQSLKKIGFELRVLHYSHKEIYLKEIDCILIKENRTTLYFLLSRLVRIIQRVFKRKINHHVEAIFGFSFTHTNDSKTIAKSIKSNLDFNPDLILTLSKGASFRPHKAMLYLPDLHSIWMAYIHDPFPFHFYPRPFNKVEAGYKQKEKFMKDVCEKAKFLSFPSLLLKEWMESYFSSIKNKSLIIPHQINEGFEKQSIPDFFIKNQFSLLHAGNLLKERNPEFLIKGYINFLEKNESAKLDSKLYFIGKYHHHEKVFNQFKENTNIICNGYIDFNTIQTLEYETSVNIILESISEISPFLPGKFPNHIKANKPIIALGPYYSEVKRLLGNDYPFWAEANDVDKIETIITKLYQSWKHNPNQLKLNRMDLVNYSNETLLKELFETLVID
jgi:glycosyltransferase involved in cell wall biosynthesis